MPFTTTRLDDEDRVAIFTNHARHLLDAIAALEQVKPLPEEWRAARDHLADVLGHP